MTTSVVERVAAASDRSVTQLPPLYDVIDPDALEALVESTRTHSTRLTTLFSYAGFRIAVDETGIVDFESTGD
ncbi:hypothetical protein EA472_05060 [Natrarchaeobius oligotrophus]|uniref:Halobacterial output domain-containing protein n=1 Tax=Natrarchaeobius chitinivorans TaxID=1679083 RepID=A0A3N6MFD6_NATCH|nr:hypothetical protein EA472_05060 [Natrarchaeobius chitinivorans]